MIYYFNSLIVYNKLLGQEVLAHFLSKESEPVQFIPLCVGSGVLHSLDLNWFPLNPQVLEQSVQFDQIDQPPLTKIKKVCNHDENIIEALKRLNVEKISKTNVHKKNTK